MTLIKKIDIPSNDPFKNDILDFYRYCEEFCHSFLYTKSDHAVVLGLVGEWGTGKSTFLEMLIAKLSLADKKTIYYNAWQRDYFHDPIIPLLGELIKFFKSTYPEPENRQFKEFIQIAKQTGTSILFNVMDNLSGGVVDIEKMKENIKKQKEDRKSLFELQFEEYEKSTSILDLFQERLEELSSKIMAMNDSPIIFIIDELDRCLPSYTLKFLERVKHIVNVPGVIFIIAYDKEQLSNSLKVLFGQSLDGNAYLQKMIDYEFELPIERNTSYFMRIFDRVLLAKGKSIADLDGRNNRQFHFIFLTRLFGLTLRDQEYIIKVVVSLANRNSFIFNYISAVIFTFFLLCLKIKKPEIFSMFKQGIVNLDYFTNHLITSLQKVSFSSDEFDDFHSTFSHLFVIISKINGQNITQLTSFTFTYHGLSIRIENQELDLISSHLVSLKKESIAILIRQINEYPANLR